MGSLRLYVALCVIRNHAEAVLPWKTHGGQDAVQIFFIISGFYMQFILGGGKYGTIGEFYLSRWLRIFIPYLIATVLIVIASVATGLVTGDFLTLAATVHPEGNGLLGTALALLSNVTVFFQDWIMFLAHDAGGPLRFTADYRADTHPLYRYLWIPPAWSVGVELTFYVIAPFLVRRLSSPAIGLVMALSFAARLFCCARLGLDHDPWTYRFFPFELFHFCLGILACRLMQRFAPAFDRITAATGGLADRLGLLFMPLMAACVLAVARLHLLGSVFIRSLVAALAGGSDAASIALSQGLAMAAWVAIVPVLFSMTRRLAADRFVGELSYPVYLLHYTVVLIVNAILFAFHLPGAINGEVAAIVSVLAAMLLQVTVLQPFDGWRQRTVLARARRPHGSGLRT